MEVEAFIQRWANLEGGAERANYALFLTELCDVLGVQRPDPAGADHANNDYTFERGVRRRESDPVNSTKRIDLYRKGAFILEAKQSRLPGGKNAIATQPNLPGTEPETLGRRGASPRWDIMMLNARRQAEDYVFLLEADHPAPPFLIVCDVGHCLELYADFTGTGRAYVQFPDRKGYRVYLEDLRYEKVRERLKAVWEDPLSLDPTRHSARVTRAIASRLAAVSKRLEEDGHNAEQVADFLMRCLFTMFAEDTGLLPKESFKGLLADCIEHPTHFPPLLEGLWKDMDTGAKFNPVIRDRVRHFNGGLFRTTKVFPLDREEIGELLAAANADWTEVDPAIFGTLLEQALDKDERARLGAHYTPKSYVQRLVEVTVMEPLREDWQAALTKAQAAKDAAKDDDAVEIVRTFHHQLCTTRVLDPACGTGNFLYVTLELMKRLEGEVIQTLSALGATQASLAIAGETVDPHQFLGLELNPRAAAIAELVIWIGYLQWHYRNHESHPAEPILRAFKNINFGSHAGYDAVLTWDGYPNLGVEAKPDGTRVTTYPNARRPAWPEAEFIVGNPPFIGNKRMKSRLSPEYVSTLRACSKTIPGSVDLVMYWFARSSELLKLKRLRRFGLVTTNSISQPLNRGPIDELIHKEPICYICFCVPDHPWVDPGEGAAVRVSMIVAELGKGLGRLQDLVTQEARRGSSDVLGYVESIGSISSSLKIGADPSSAKPLVSNRATSHQGVILVGEGFRLTPKEREHLVNVEPQSAALIRPYLIGQDITGNAEQRFIISANKLAEDELRRNHPNIYSTLYERVRPARLSNNDKAFRTFWWKHGRSRPEIDELNESLSRYIATCRTAKHRLFVFLGKNVVPDAKIIYIGLEGGHELAILSSKIHVIWSFAAGAWLGFGNDSNYNHSSVFDPFPFPDAPEAVKARLRDLGEELDATRKTVQAEHPDLTLTGLYNVLEKLRAGTPLDARDEDVKTRGRVLILKELHDQIDAATFEAYGWPADLTDEQILERLVALNAERAREEAAGHVRWLRPDYQIPRFAKTAQAKSGDLDLGETVVAIDKSLPDFPKDPYEAPLAIERLLAASGQPMTATELSRAFKRGGKRIEQRIVQALATLARYGAVTDLKDGRYAARRAA